MSSTGPASALVKAVRAGLADLADPGQAEQMRAYMKSSMPYRGVPTPPRGRMTKRLFAEHPLPDRNSWLAAVLTLVAVYFACSGPPATTRDTVSTPDR